MRTRDHYRSIKETQRAYIANLIGEEEESISATTPYWAKLMKEGVLIRLHIGRWRAKKALTWSDLGIEIDRKVEKDLKSILNLGHKSLLPASILKRLDAIESKARKYLVKMSFTTYWGAFVPVTAYPEWKEGNQEILTEYYDTADDLIKRYDQVKAETLAIYRQAAGDAYNRLKALSPESVKTGQADFTDKFLAGIAAAIPPAGEVERSFRFEVDLEYIPLPSLMAADKLEVDRIEAERERVAMRRYLQQEQDSLKRRTFQTAEENRREVLRIMNEDVVKEAKMRKEELVDDFLQSVTVQLRSMVYDTTVDVLDRIQKQQKLGPRSVVQLKNMISQVAKLNFHDDEELKRMTNELQFKIDQQAKDRDLNQIEAKLADVGTVLRASLITLGQEPRSQRLAGISIIPDDPSEAELRRARKSLRLDNETTEEQPILLDLGLGQRQARDL